MVKLEYPQAAMFARAASMHLDAARLLINVMRTGVVVPYIHWEALYLDGYAVECILKAAYLSELSPRDHPKTIREFFKKINHDMERLAAALVEKGQPLPPEQKANLRWIRSRWSSEMRYLPKRLPAKIAQHGHECAESLFAYLLGV